MRNPKDFPTQISLRVLVGHVDLPTQVLPRLLCEMYSTHCYTFNNRWTFECAQSTAAVTNFIPIRFIFDNQNNIRKHFFIFSYLALKLHEYNPTPLPHLVYVDQKLINPCLHSVRATHTCSTWLTEVLNTTLWQVSILD